MLNSALSYFYVCKQSLIIADQRQYIVTAWQNGLDMVLCAVLGNAGFFIAYCRREEFRYFVQLILGRFTSIKHI